eukprot:TRINITY_DN3061_c0_g1_i2.p2 TRINITY_DN3061_c0_g1~~TRINITY_DN3061_c0_g1_i2.p2  ORF type:complete len:124 (-),score=4.21 TRINITY_DN3061_c0_g1_i2:34-405(-)
MSKTAKKNKGNWLGENRTEVKSAATKVLPYLRTFFTAAAGGYAGALLITFKPLYKQGKIRFWLTSQLIPAATIGTLWTIRTYSRKKRWWWPFQFFIQDDHQYLGYCDLDLYALIQQYGSKELN